MTGILGKKIGMTCVFDEKGESVPCTDLIVKNPPNTIKRASLTTPGSTLPNHTRTGSTKHSHINTTRVAELNNAFIVLLKSVGGTRGA